ncbi:MAG: hypothetical protein H6842_03390 [Rhodospirillaceae bacterium]|nr:hypothetical protein [Rhodospirillaceae bacterium]
MTDLDRILPLCPDGPVPRTVLLFSRIDFAWLNPILMAGMRERWGTRFIVMAPGESWRAFYQPHLRDGDQLHVSADLVREAEEASLGDEAAVFARARAIEQRFGIALLRDVLQQARNLACFWLTFAPNSAFAYRTAPPYVETIKQACVFLEYFEALIAREGVDLVVERPGDLLSTCCLMAAEAAQVPTTFWLPARNGSFVMFADGPYLGHRLIRAAYDRLPDPEPMPLEALAPPDDSRRNFGRAKELRSLRHLGLGLWRTTRDHAIWKVQRVLKGRRHRGLGYRAMVRQQVSVWRLHNALARRIESDMGRLCAQPFVLFLLQFEPEYTTLSLARQFNDTRAVVQQCALALPAGFRLVVKENVNSIGNRALSFYDDMLKLPNVILADHSIRGLDLMPHAAAVATISSTGALEANLFGRRSLIFAPQVEFSFLPDVQSVTSFHDLPAVMRHAVAEIGEDERRAIRVRATRYRQALEAVSFQAPGTRPFRGTGTTLPDGEAERAVDRLLDCFRLQKAGQQAIPDATAAGPRRVLVETGGG